MNAPIPTRTFKNGNSVALRLPKALGVAPDQDMLVELRGGELVAWPKVDADHERQRLIAFLERMRALPSPGEVEVRDTEEIPERPGL